MTKEVEKDPKIRAKLAALADEFEGASRAKLYAHAADFFAHTGDLDRAIRSMESAVRAEDGSAIFHFGLAKLLLQAGRFREGGKQLEICSEIDSVALASRTYHENNLYYLAYALFNVGRYKEAAEAFRGAQNLINIWVDPLVLKHFHLHQGFAWHLEKHYLDAAECYRRAMVAPGPGDSCDEDVMDEDVVEAAQEFNDEIEPFHDMAQRGVPLDRLTLDVQPHFP